MSRNFRRQFFPSLAIGIVVFVLVLSAQRFGWLQRWELYAYDELIRARHNPSIQDDRIVIIGITEEDLTQFGHPLDDEQLASLIESVRSAQPRAIGLDLYRNLPEPRTKGASPHLASVLRETENLIAIFSLPDARGKHIPPPPALADRPDRLAFNDFPIDQNVVRRGLLFAKVPDGETYESFALSLAEKYLEQDVEPAGSAHPEWVKLGKAELRRFRKDDGGYVGADDRGYQILLDFKSPETFARFSYGDIVAGRVPPDSLRDKIVLIAAAAESVKDNRETPLCTDCDGIVLHAQIINQLLREAIFKDAQVRVLPELGEMALCLVLALIGAFCGLLLLRYPIWATLLFAGGFAVLVLLARTMFFHDLWIPSVAWIVGYTLSAICSLGLVYFLKRRELGDLMQMFSQHVSVKVAQSLWDQRDKFLDGNRPRSLKLTASVLFTDYVNFSSVAEDMEPVALLDWLNMGMERLARQVEKHDGIIIKYMGDSIMAVFGAPIPRTSQREIAHDAQSAVRCALAMAAELEKCNQRWETEGLPKIAMRIGIYTGSVVAGCIGSSARLEYTATGDTVNIASRLESMGKYEIPPPSGRCCRILAGEATCELFGDSFKTEFVGEETLKGKAKKIKVFRVVDEQNVKSEE